MAQQPNKDNTTSPPKSIKKKCVHYFVEKNGIFKCKDCQTTMGEWLQTEIKIRNQ